MHLFAARDSQHRTFGFTLIELLVVVSLIIILAGFVMRVINPSGLKDETRDSVQRATLSKLISGIEAYYSVEGHYPANLGDSELLYYVEVDSWPAEYSYWSDGVDEYVIVVANTLGEYFKYHSSWSEIASCTNGGNNDECEGTGSPSTCGGAPCSYACCNDTCCSSGQICEVYGGSCRDVGTCSCDNWGVTMDACGSTSTATCTGRYTCECSSGGTPPPPPTCGGSPCDNVCCNDVCCAASEVCTGGTCCDPADVCGSVCGCPSGEICESGVCTSDCIPASGFCIPYINDNCCTGICMRIGFTYRCVVT